MLELKVRSNGPAPLTFNSLDVSYHQTLVDINVKQLPVEQLNAINHIFSQFPFLFFLLKIPPKFLSHYPTWVKLKDCL